MPPRPEPAAAPGHPRRPWPPAQTLDPHVGPRPGARDGSVRGRPLRRPPVRSRSSRRRLRRTSVRLRRWSPAVVLVAAALAGLVTATSVRDALATQEAWGPTRVVAIARRELPAGTVIGPDDVAWERRPLATLSDEAAPSEAAPSEADDLAGRLVVARILTGEVVARSRLAPDGARGLAAQVPPRRVALAVPTDARTPPLEAGQAVDLYAVGDPAGAGATWPGTPTDRFPTDRLPTDATAGRPDDAAPRLARRAPVLQVAERQVTVAVTDDEAPAVAQALLGGTVLVVLTGP